MVVISADNTSVMAGINNDVCTKLKEDVPSIILMTCTCHSMPLSMFYVAIDVYQGLFLLQKVKTGFHILLSDNGNTITCAKPKMIIHHL